MKKQFSILAILAAVLLAALAASPVGAKNGGGEVIGVTGIVPGQDLMVHVIAVVPAGAKRSEVAKQALANQGARAMTKEEFSTIALHWDQFFDTDPNNDKVIRNYNPSNDPTGGGLAALLASQSIWNDVESSSFFFESGDNSISRCPSLVKECPGRQTFDGLNDVAWMSIKGNNTLGVTWSGTSTDEADMALNTKFNWTLNGGDYDVQTVLTHENGHALGLGHSEVLGAAMEATYAGERRTLHADDILGVSTLYPDGPVNAAPTISISSPSDGTEVAEGGTVDLAGAAADTEDGDLTGSIAWSSDLDGSLGTGGSVLQVSLSNGTHLITASVTDSGSATTNASVTVTVGAPPPPPPPPPGSVTVDTITYDGTGGKNNDVHLLVGVALSSPIVEAAVSVTLYRNESVFGSATGLTDSSGVAHFKARKAPAGAYTTVVTGITGADWDGLYPANGTDWP